MTLEEIVRGLNAGELDLLVEAFDSLPVKAGSSEAGRELRRAVNVEESRRAAAGEEVVYTGRNA